MPDKLNMSTPRDSSGAPSLNVSADTEASEVDVECHENAFFLHTGAPVPLDVEIRGDQQCREDQIARNQRDLTERELDVAKFETEWDANKGLGSRPEILRKRLEKERLRLTVRTRCADGGDPFGAAVNAIDHGLSELNTVLRTVASSSTNLPDLGTELDMRAREAYSQVLTASKYISAVARNRADPVPADTRVITRREYGSLPSLRATFDQLSEELVTIYGKADRSFSGTKDVGDLSGLSAAERRSRCAAMNRLLEQNADASDEKTGTSSWRELAEASSRFCLIDRPSTDSQMDTLPVPALMSRVGNYLHDQSMNALPGGMFPLSLHWKRPPVA